VGNKAEIPALVSLKRNELLEALAGKQQSPSKQSRAGNSKPNPGQEEAEFEKTSKEQMSHIERGKASQPTQRRFH
jgi:hypothetical protein